MIQGHVPVCCARIAGATLDPAVDVAVQQQLVLQPFYGMAVPNPVLPIAGLLLLPTTTLGFCWASSAFGGVSTFSGTLVVAIGVIIDLGLIGNGRGMAKR